MAPVAVNTSTTLPSADISISTFSWSPKDVQKSATSKKPAMVDDPTYPNLRRSQEPRSEFSFDTMEVALEAFARGEFLVVMDDENRENEGDIIISASKCTTEKMAWMIKHTRYELCSISPTLTTSTELQWLHLHLALGRTPHGARHSHDGSGQPRAPSYRIYGDCRL